MKQENYLSAFRKIIIVLRMYTGFPDCEPYFLKLTNDSLECKQKEMKKIFLSYGAKDFLDPDGVIEKQLSNFTQLIEADESIDCQYKIYEEEGHVPFQSLYHGLKFIFE